MLAARCQGGIGPSTCQPVDTPTGHGTLPRVPVGEYDIVGAHGPGFPVLTITPPVHITVTPGSTFDCTFLGNAGTCGQADDADGVTPATENAGPNGGDGNHDGVPDANQANVTSLPSSAGPYVTIAAPGSTTLANVVATDPATLPTPPDGATVPVGVLGFDIEGVPAGGAVDVKVFLPTGTNPNTYLKFQHGAWSDFTAHASFAGDVVTLHLVDGGAGDADGVANGVISDPGAPAIAAPPFAGFLPPIKNPPAANSAKAGSAVPIKFSLGGNKGMNIFAPGFPKSQPCGTPNATSIDTPGSSSLTYDAKTGLYQINWKTQKTWAGCRELVVQFANGAVGKATFNFK